MRARDAYTGTRATGRIAVHFRKREKTLGLHIPVRDQTAVGPASRVARYAIVHWEIRSGIKAAAI